MLSVCVYVNDFTMIFCIQCIFILSTHLVTLFYSFPIPTNPLPVSNYLPFCLLRMCGGGCLYMCVYDPKVDYRSVARDLFTRAYAH